MHKQTIKALNAPVGFDKDHTVYVSLEDIECAETVRNKYDDKTTVLYLKCGNQVKVLGDFFCLFDLGRDD